MIGSFSPSSVVTRLDSQHAKIIYAVAPEAQFRDTSPLEPFLPLVSRRIDAGTLCMIFDRMLGQCDLSRKQIPLCARLSAKERASISIQSLSLSGLICLKRDAKGQSYAVPTYALWSSLNDWCEGAGVLKQREPNHDYLGPQERHQCRDQLGRFCSAKNCPRI